MVMHRPRGKDEVLDGRVALVGNDIQSEEVTVEAHEVLGNGSGGRWGEMRCASSRVPPGTQHPYRFNLLGLGFSSADAVLYLLPFGLLFGLRVVSERKKERNVATLEVRPVRTGALPITQRSPPYSGRVLIFLNR